MADLLDAGALFRDFASTNPLPTPTRIDTETKNVLVMKMAETEPFLGLYDPESDEEPTTTAWGYGTGGTVSYPGPTTSPAPRAGGDRGGLRQADL